MDYQKPVKVKSRWTQSCQMEKLIEESQSSLDMSDTITDVSTSDLNESPDYNSEVNSVELRRSLRTSNNRTDYRRLNGLKTIQQKTCVTTNILKNKGRKRKQLSNNSKEDKLKKKISQKSNTIQPTICQNNINIFESKRLSKSVNNITEEVEKCPQKSIRRASLSWQFTFTPPDELESNYSNMSCANKHLNLNLNGTLKITSLPNDSNQINKNSNIIANDNLTQENSSQELFYLDTVALNCRDIDLNNGLINVKPDKISEINCNEKKESAKLNLHVNCSPVLENLICNPVYEPRQIRSKSCDTLVVKTNITNNTLRRHKSYDDINKLDNYVVNPLKLPIQHKSFKRKRRQSKRIKPKNNYIEIFDDIKIPVVNYDQIADEIYNEHKNQLFEARINDKEFDQKLKYTNFTLIDENLYRPNRHTLKLNPSEIPTSRKLKQRVISADINDYCECTLSKEDIIGGNIGCDDRCLNRLLKVECGLGCSLKRYCTNKQFQNKQFKKTSIIKTEYKGYGICADENIPKGVLISEYVGEVIDYNEMCNRLKKEEYKNLNYMVQLNPDEIIDSTSKGNVTRFINHSCDPNAVGEKWHVLGQSRIGFFSTRDIMKGEEITFDYSFQIFGDGAQICYCGSSNCRGYITKASQITVLSSSEDSDGPIENRLISTCDEKQKKTISEKRTNYNDRNKLRELSRQLTDIAKLKSGLKTDQELATLNLNRLMVHITDSVSRLHVLTFIREHDMNKRLFMDFSGLSIIHNWMTSNENESFKLMILDILAELPITNRNTITKSKVLDVVTEWAKIPQNITNKMESFEHPATEELQEIDQELLTNNETINSFVKKARDLWKKWIILKMVFKIPKKTDQHKPIKEINSNKSTENVYASSMDIPTIDRKIDGDRFRTNLCSSNKYTNKVRNHQTVSSERLKLRKEFELKVEQEQQQQMFRKKVMNDWFENIEVVKKKIDQNCLQHQQTKLYTCDNSILNHNNEINEHTIWDYSSNISQNSTEKVQNSYFNTMPIQQPQSLVEYPQYSYVQPQISYNYHQMNQSTFFNTPPPLIPNHSHNLINTTQSHTSINEVAHQNVKSSIESPSKKLMKIAETNVFNLINESLQRHKNSTKIQNINTENEHPKKLCSKAVQSGADLLARIKIISDMFKKQPSKLIKIKQLKLKNGKTKPSKLPTSDTILKSVCNKNKNIIFINEQTGVTSNIISEDLIPSPKTIPLSKTNEFANSILNSLLKKTDLAKENLVPKKFVLEDLNSDLITFDDTNKEIELYNNMKPKIIKNVVARVKTKNGVVAIMKRQWGFKLKNFNGMHDKIPATKRNIMRKGTLHNLSFKSCVFNSTKSALKKQNSINVDDYLNKPKEKRVTFWIGGKVIKRPINLNENIVKQKPLMKCHPFEIRNEPKSILHPSTSAILDNNLQFPQEQSFETTNEHIITPIVAKFKASRSRRMHLRDKSADLEHLLSQRKHTIPISMMSLSIEVLKLIPDNKKEMKKVIDYYHSMATIIVKALGSYAKKTCQQGRIRSDEDFKFLAKKINENVLLKELQIKKVDKLKISNNTKFKVTEYIKKYMSRFGEIYKKKKQ